VREVHARRFIHLNEQSTKYPESATAAVAVPAVAVPAVTVPAVTVPAVTVPAVAVPAVTVPAVAGKCLKSVPANDGQQLGSIVRQKLSCVH
jgi:hypothetical protein